MVDDLSDLSRIETGKIDLAFANQNLNELVESCVAVMQPQANRERIIIRTSLAHTLPPVVADARALRQIALNLIGNSIQLAKAGGQVIVSTALSDSARSCCGCAIPARRSTTTRLPPRWSRSATRTADQASERRRQPFADQGAGRGQSSPLPDQARAAFRHAGRGGVFARGGAGVALPMSQFEIWSGRRWRLFQWATPDAAAVLSHSRFQKNYPR